MKTFKEIIKAAKEYSDHEPLQDAFREGARYAVTESITSLLNCSMNQRRLLQKPSLFLRDITIPLKIGGTCITKSVARRKQSRNGIDSP